MEILPVIADGVKVFCHPLKVDLVFFVQSCLVDLHTESPLAGRGGKRGGLRKLKEGEKEEGRRDEGGGGMKLKKKGWLMRYKEKRRLLTFSCSENSTQDLQLLAIAI